MSSRRTGFDVNDTLLALVENRKKKLSGFVVIIHKGIGRVDCGLSSMKRQEKKRRPGLKRLTTRVMDERLSLIIRLFISPAAGAADAADACVSTYSCVVKNNHQLVIISHYLDLLVIGRLL